MTNANMTCAEFDAALSDYLEGTLDDSTGVRVQKHLGECVRCASLTRDLEKITTDAAALPDMLPTRDLWQGIEARIAASVIPLTSRPERQRRFAPAWMGVAAAALVVSTAGVTYMLTARSLQRSPTGSGAVAQATPVAPGQGADSEPAVTPGTVSSVSPSTVAQSSPAANLTGSESQPRGTVPGARVASQTKPVGPQPSDAIYGKEIEMLETIVRDRKSRLDSTTIATIERNLQIIDAAIAQSRAALVKDPASRFLGDQLTHALDKKVELLRTAALLPVSI
jgi:hypothetical protein